MKKGFFRVKQLADQTFSRYTIVIIIYTNHPYESRPLIGNGMCQSWVLTIETKFIEYKRDSLVEIDSLELDGLS